MTRLRHASRSACALVFAAFAFAPFAQANQEIEIPERILEAVGEIIFYVEAGIVMSENCDGSLTVPIYDVLYIDQVFRDKTSLSYLELVELMRDEVEINADQEIREAVFAIIDQYGCTQNLADFWFGLVESGLYPKVRELEAYPNAN